MTRFVTWDVDGKGGSSALYKYAQIASNPLSFVCYIYVIHYSPSILLHISFISFISLSPLPHQLRLHSVLRLRFPLAILSKSLFSSNLTPPHPTQSPHLFHLTSGHYRPLAEWSRFIAWPSIHARRKAFKIRKTSKSVYSGNSDFSVAPIDVGCLALQFNLPQDVFYSYVLSCH